MLNSITNLIPWNSIWNPYTFPGAQTIVMLVILTMVITVSFTALFFGRKTAAGVLKKELLLYWLFTIFSATLLARKETAEPKINMELFWTVRYAWERHSRIHWFYILGNIALFIPLGYLLPMNGKIFKFSLLTVLFGFLLSVAIEATQYFFRIGLCELDDMFNNTWGTLLGYSIYRLTVPGLRGQSRMKEILNFVSKCGCALIILGTVVLFFTLLKINLAG